ncbi:MAG: 3-methyl-2-oxobutanoate hydroxymethyltransferase [Coxiellaceae bacterium]|nr:MAG: 3-methyl-2-oxobutanoate hydroxymethyltransferase [Coxiellaceae bacterium]
MVTCYDYCMAKILAATDIDSILVGDSVAMVMYGHPNTIPATVDMLVNHTGAVSKGAPNKFIVADLPFLSYRKSISNTLSNVEQLIRAGAQAVKLEGADGNLETIHHIVESGIPVMGHIGLTIQHLHQLGGFRSQGADEAVAERLLQQAIQLQQAGCFAIVLECIKYDVVQRITDTLKIPTIGIGAGKCTDGQILVLQDLLGLYNDIHPRFVKQYCRGFDLIKEALNRYKMEVINEEFPESKHAY